LQLSDKECEYAIILLNWTIFALAWNLFWMSRLSGAYRIKNSNSISEIKTRSYPAQISGFLKKNCSGCVLINKNTLNSNMKIWQKTTNI